MSGRYAEGTSVPIDRSIGEIRQTLERYGAEGFGYGAEDGRAMVVFKADGRLVRFVLPLPSPDDPVFTRKRRGRRLPTVRQRKDLRAGACPWRGERGRRRVRCWECCSCSC